MNYDKLKLIGQVIIPAIITCVTTILTTLNCQYTETIAIIMGALLTCYNSVIVWWNKEYYKQQVEVEKSDDHIKD